MASQFSELGIGAEQLGQLVRARLASCSTRWRPRSPIAERRSGSSISSTSLSAKSAGSLGLAYSDELAAEYRPSLRSNCTIGLARPCTP